MSAASGLIALALSASLSGGALLPEAPVLRAPAPDPVVTAAPEEPGDLLPVLGVAGTSVALTAAVLGLGTRAWWDEGFEPFSFKHAGWFGADTYSGGADKAGHAASCYVGVHLTASLYELFGVKPKAATWLAAGLTFALFNGFEFIDGFTHYGFEYGDSVANTFGIAAGVVTRLSPTAGSLFALRMNYFPSRDFVAHEKSTLKFINDYTGVLYQLDLKGKGVMEQLGRDPGAWRYVLGGITYGTQGYSPIKQPEAERRRMLGLHVGLSIPEVVRALGPRGAATNGVAKFFELYGMPGVSLMLLNDLNGSGWYLSLGVGERAQLPL